MAITYDAPNNVITVTGYTEGTPCTFEDVYQADQAGGWGVVSKQGTTQYLFDCRLVIGDGSTTTWFADTEKQITFNDGVMTAKYQKWFELKRYGHIRFGVLEDATEKRTSRGCSFISLENSYQGYIIYEYALDTTAYLYSCSISGKYRNVVYGNNLRLYNSILHYQTYLEDRTTSDVFNTVIARADYGIGYPRGTWDKVTITDMTYAMYMRYAGTISNLYIREATYLCRFSSFNYGDFYLVNCDTDTWAMYWGTGTSKLCRQYTFNVKVTEQDGTAINGATVTLKDKDGNTVFNISTDAQGEITEQTVSRGYYDQAHGDTLLDYSPHTLTIEKAGYQTYEKKFTLEEKTNWEIKLAKAVGVFLDFGRPVINLKKSEPENKNVMVL